MELEKFAKNKKDEVGEEDNLRLELIEDAIKNNAKIEDSLKELIR